jgi:probable HAF family extracellular repeat protein
VVLLPACDPPVRVDVVVSDPGTAGDAAPGDGVCEATTGAGDCSFRAAIEETNAQPSADVVTIADGVDPTPGGAVPITGSLEIRGGGTTLGERLVHTAGTLVLRDLSIVGASGAPTCGGAIASTGAGVALDRVQLRENSTTASTGGGVCATGDVVVLDSTLVLNMVTGAVGSGAGIAADGDIVVVRSELRFNRRNTYFATSQVASHGSASLTVLHSTLRSAAGSPVLEAASASGRIVASRLDGTSSLNPAITVAASSVGGCAAAAQPTSEGYNLFVDGSCPTVATDRVAADHAFDSDGAPYAWSPAVDAIPAGTPGLCPGPLGTDQEGGERPLFGSCDIGPRERPSRVRATPHTTVGPWSGTSVPSSVSAINDAGAVAGTTATPSGSTSVLNAVRWAPDGTRIVVAPDGSRALGIGADGSVAGSWTDAGRKEAFAWRADTETFVDLGTLPGDTSAEALDIDAGWVVGSSTGPTGSRPWAASEATGLVELPGLGGPTGAAVAVNGSGLAVGWSTTSSGVRRAVQWDLAAGSVTDLGSGAAPHASEAVDVDAAGNVIGTVFRPDLGEDCYNPGYGVPACPFSQAFRWDAATGVLTQAEGMLGPVAGAAFGPDGTIVEVVTRNRRVTGLPGVTRLTYLYDPTTGEHALLAFTPYFGAFDANSSGVVVGSDFRTSSAGQEWVPTQLTVNLAG